MTPLQLARLRRLFGLSAPMAAALAPLIYGGGAE